MKKAFVVLLALLQSLATSVALADPPKLWIEGRPGLKPEVLTDGKKRVEPGFIGTFDVRGFAPANSPALPHIERQESCKTRAKWVYWAGVIPSAALLGAGLGSDNSAVTWVGVGALLGTMTWMGYYATQSRRSMWDAINTINGVTPSAPAERTESKSESFRLSWGAAPTPGGATLALGWSF